jgi:hypothetical protein
MGVKKVTKIEKVDIRKGVFIPVKGGAKLCIKLNEFNGYKSIDFRKYTESEKYTGFTKEGYGAPIEAIDIIINALQEIKKVIQAEGLKNEEGEE